MKALSDLLALLPADRPGLPADAGLAARRNGMAEALRGRVGGTEPPATEVTIAGVRALRFSPSATSRGVVLHFHGGGYRMGSPEMGAPYAAALAQACSVTVVCPAYRLAPEHPYPAGLRDAAAIMASLRAEHDGALIVAGDSAGGGLAAALTAVAAAAGAPPDGLICLSAWLDLTVSAGSYASNAATDPLFSRDSAEQAAGLYLQGLAPDTAFASPMHGDVKGFPPTLISAGEPEVLVDDALVFHAKLQAAGVRSTLSIVPGMEHTAVARSLALTGAAETFAAVTDFVDGIVRSAD
jgi:acetyl esterase/lipase